MTDDLTLGEKIGRILESVEKMEVEVSSLQEKVAHLQEDMDSIARARSTARWFVRLFAKAAGFVGLGGWMQHKFQWLG